MSREDLIHTLRDALTALNLMTQPDEGDIQIPDDDAELHAIAEVRPRRSLTLPLSW